MLSKDVYWLRSLVGITGCISWLFACGSVAYAMAVIASVEYAVVDHLELTKFKSGLLLIALSGAATMITGMIGSCGALRLAKSSLLLYSCLATIECLGFLAAGSLALHSRIGMEVDLRRKYDHLIQNFDPNSDPLNAETQTLDSIQTLLKCCGKSGKRDFESATTPSRCIRMAFADQGCHRKSMNWLMTGLFHQSVVGFVGALLLRFFSVLLSAF